MSDVCRSRPLVAAAEQRARVLRAVDRRDEERVRRHVVDELELPLRVRLDEAVGSERLRDGTHRRSGHDRCRHRERRGAEACRLSSRRRSRTASRCSSALTRASSPAEVSELHASPPFRGVVSTEREPSTLVIRCPDISLSYDERLTSWSSPPEPPQTEKPANYLSATCSSSTFATIPRGRPAPRMRPRTARRGSDG